MDPLSNYDTWIFLLKEALDSFTNYDALLSEAPQLVFSILETGMLPEPIQSYTDQFINTDIHMLILKTIMINPLTQEERDVTVEFLNAIVLLGIWAIQEDKNTLIDDLPLILDEKKQVYQRDISDSTNIFLFETESFYQLILDNFILSQGIEITCERLKKTDPNPNEFHICFAFYIYNKFKNTDSMPNEKEILNLIITSFNNFISRPIFDIGRADTKCLKSIFDNISLIQDYDFNLLFNFLLNTFPSDFLMLKMTAINFFKDKVNFPFFIQFVRNNKQAFIENVIFKEPHENVIQTAVYIFGCLSKYGIYGVETATEIIARSENVHSTIRQKMLLVAARILSEQSDEKIQTETHTRPINTVSDAMMFCSLFDALINTTRWKLAVPIFQRLVYIESSYPFISMHLISAATFCGRFGILQYAATSALQLISGTFEIPTEITEIGIEKKPKDENYNINKFKTITNEALGYRMAEAYITQNPMQPLDVNFIQDILELVESHRDIVLRLLRIAFIQYPNFILTDDIVMVLGLTNQDDEKMWELFGEIASQGGAKRISAEAEAELLSNAGKTQNISPSIIFAIKNIIVASNERIDNIVKEGTDIYFLSYPSNIDILFQIFFETGNSLVANDIIDLYKKCQFIDKTEVIEEMLHHVMLSDDLDNREFTSRCIFMSFMISSYESGNTPIECHGNRHRGEILCKIIGRGNFEGNEWFEWIVPNESENNLLIKIKRRRPNIAYFLAYQVFRDGKTKYLCSNMESAQNLLSQTINGYPVLEITSQSGDATEVPPARDTPSYCLESRNIPDILFKRLAVFDSIENSEENDTKSINESKAIIECLLAQLPTDSNIWELTEKPSLFVSTMEKWSESQKVYGLQALLKRCEMCSEIIQQKYGNFLDHFLALVEGKDSNSSIMISLVEILCFICKFDSKDQQDRDIKLLKIAISCASSPECATSCTKLMKDIAKSDTNSIVTFVSTDEGYKQLKDAIFVASVSSFDGIKVVIGCLDAQQQQKLFVELLPELDRLDSLWYQADLLVGIFSILIKGTAGSVPTDVFRYCVNLALQSSGRELVCVCGIIESLVLGAEEGECGFLETLLKRSLEGTDSAERRAILNLCGVGYPRLSERIDDVLERALEKKITYWEIDPSEEIRPSLGFVGLRNLGMTCYMNSVVQLLYNLKIFCQRMFEETAPKDSFTSLQKLLLEMEYSNKRYSDPSPFVSSFKWGGTRPIALGQQEDAGEFFSELMDQLPSSVSDCCRGKIVNTFTGPDGVVRSENVEDFFMVQLNVKGMSNIDEAFDEFLQGETFSGFKDKDGSSIEVVKKMRIRKVPEVLVFQLKRFEYSLKTGRRVKINSPFEFGLKVNIKKLTEDNEGDSEYRLKSVVLHAGLATSGHYTLLGGLDTDCPLVFNDKEVYYASHNALQESFGSQCADTKASAYLLIYERIKPDIDEERKEYSEEINKEIEIIQKQNKEHTEKLTLLSREFVDFFGTYLQSRVALSFFFRIAIHLKMHPGITELADSLVKQDQRSFAEYITSNPKEMEEALGECPGEEMGAEIIKVLSNVMAVINENEALILKESFERLINGGLTATRRLKGIGEVLIPAVQSQPSSFLGMMSIIDNAIGSFFSSGPSSSLQSVTTFGSLLEAAAAVAESLPDIDVTQEMENTERNAKKLLGNKSNVFGFIRASAVFDRLGKLDAGDPFVLQKMVREKKFESCVYLTSRLSHQKAAEMFESFNETYPLYSFDYNRKAEFLQKIVQKDKRMQRRIIPSFGGSVMPLLICISGTAQSIAADVSRLVNFGDHLKELFVPCIEYLSEYKERLFYNDFIGSSILLCFSRLVFGYSENLPDRVPDQLVALMADCKQISLPDDGVSECLGLLYVLFVRHGGCEFDAVLKILSEDVHGRANLRLTEINYVVSSDLDEEERRKLIGCDELGRVLRSIFRMRLQRSDEALLRQILNRLPELIDCVLPEGVQNALELDSNEVFVILSKLEKIPTKMSNGIIEYSLCQSAFPQMLTRGLEIVLRALEYCDDFVLQEATAKAIGGFIRNISISFHDISKLLTTVASRVPRSRAILSGICRELIVGGKAIGLDFVNAVLEHSSDEEVCGVMEGLTESFLSAASFAEREGVVEAMAERISRTGGEFPDWAVCAVAWFAASYTCPDAVVPIVRQFAERATADQVLAVAASTNNDIVATTIVGARKGERELFEECHNYSIKCAIRAFEKEAGQ